jgi:hypothetical protein
MTSWRPAGSLRVLTIVDIFSRFSPAVEPRFSFSRVRGERNTVTAGLFDNTSPPR